MSKQLKNCKEAASPKIKLSWKSHSICQKGNHNSKFMSYCPRICFKLNVSQTQKLSRYLLLTVLLLLLRALFLFLLQKSLFMVVGSSLIWKKKKISQNDHSLSLIVIRCHSLSFSVTRCHSLSLVVTHCHSLHHSLSLVCYLIKTIFFCFKCVH